MAKFRTVRCELETCSEVFPYSSRHPHKRFCSPKCQKKHFTNINGYGSKNENERGAMVMTPLHIARLIHGAWPFMHETLREHHEQL